MTDRRTVEERIVESGVIAVMRGISTERIVPVARALHEGGVDALEITADEPHARDKIAAVDRELADPDVVVGAGTVLDAATAQSVIDAGATFVVSPHVDREIIRTCNRHNVLASPGVMTPTEAVTALEAGADILKMFPAETVGPGHIGALKGPLGNVEIIPTGGVSADNVADYFDAGALAVGAGSALIDYDAIADDDMDGVREHAESFVEAVEDARSE
ncbi:bifunctional 4-hydroxy-2-oxoglutarate aldolase/2-dehydro-3-deoxy-phosphogluconate aldolase [Halopiger aswanensis]|uniref:2-keto-3-deoxy-phosphogluconate aldolase n=1 Tax=Halopiger aswanensis TaxID=148449 RepID=A0A3R7EEZ1_9EURY|nr:bifunctional 4-hydroxy-2-oxoglutarate aldolase/2-dehydro-3-deoxy-phosphogluconate aldolase [Halopiger aswanensis]RKD95183.1 2-keto-3-deoxy-phosphogluconate aldolase [Halopiger aswanensis]